MACDVWNTATRLFVAVIDSKYKALIEASRSRISKAEKVEMVLAGLPPEFDAVRAVQDALLYANLLETVPSSALVGFIRGGRSPSEGHGRGFQSCIQCQIYGRFGHLAQRCFFCYNREYDSPSLIVRMSNLANRHGPGVLFLFDGTLIYKAMWREAKECLYVGPKVGGGDSKGVFWYRNKF
ncbi:hypothetical protein Goshw_025050 [Gossypium schwendimanii]|uniref:Uncharacterized protein n=1 Tax=Gossypium schwendimanii TaxID=34291 RepID=A0A7J9MV60_GOSSC|nr:hypothetical protein [Gossypium schwendimanii]